MRRLRGFTLVELLVALFALALLAAMSWRGLDGMMRAREQTETRAADVIALQTGLAQWTADLDAIVQFAPHTALEWNGRVLRLTRSNSTSETDGALVVAWTRREGQWLRWQSLPVISRGELEAAWAEADQWALNAGTAQRQREVLVVPLEEWQVFFSRGGNWTNPMSSSAGAQVALPPVAAAPATPGAPAPPLATGSRNAGTLPDGVRLLLQLPAGRPISGQITKDWVRPGFRAT